MSDWTEPQTIEEAEAQVLRLAGKWHAYGAMIHQCREAWNKSLQEAYGLPDGVWDVTRDLAMAKLQARLSAARAKVEGILTHVQVLKTSGYKADAKVWAGISGIEAAATAALEELNRC